jgi:hypothetical protein
MHDDPDHNATPYNWHLSPITIASGPIPPNEAEIAHAQEVVQFCSSERLARLDDLNQLSYAVLYPQRFDWTFASKEDVVAASRAAQDDLDLIAACASNAMNNTKDALMPAGFAEAQGKTYPSMTAMPDPMPSVKLGERAAYEARGASIAAAEEIAGAMREAEPAGMARRGFDYGLGWSELSTSWGPGARKVEQELEPEARASFHRATEYSIVRNANAAALERGSGVIKADPAVAAARAAHQPAGLHWLGFTIATGLYGDKALGADGSNPPRGPGGERIRDTFTAVDGKNGFDDGQNFNWAHRGVG